VRTVQINIGLYCNQVELIANQSHESQLVFIKACSHCHVESSPRRIREMMSEETAEKCVQLLKSSPQVQSVDITGIFFEGGKSLMHYPSGGAPELCPQFRYLAQSASDLDLEVIDRCNLTALLEPGQEDTVDFLSKCNATIIASLPCYSPKNVDTQRGSGVFKKSILALRKLNSSGYGRTNGELKLHLVYNPLGAFLPPSQSLLEVKYREELWSEFGVEFDRLFAMTNMPIKRFADFLYRRCETM